MPSRFTKGLTRALSAAALLAGLAAPLAAQTPPDAAELRRYTGLHRAAANGEAHEILRLIAQGANPDATESNRRTPLHVAAFASKPEAIRALVKGGANPNALDAQRYDIVAILAVKDDVDTLKAALNAGASARNLTSPWDGTALIAAAHLGHDGVVRELIRAGAPLDHVNNLGWTAVIEAVVLGNGGRRHVETLRALVESGASVKIADRQGRTPRMLALERGYGEMASILERAEAR